jgi:KDZ transposase family protein
LEGRYSVQTALLKITDRICFITSKYQTHFLIHDTYLLIYILQSWNGRFFERVTLKSLNCRIQLGHPIGEPCLLKYPAAGDSFVVVDTSGIHEVGLDYCGCGVGGNEVTQLLRFRLYPATVQRPNTAATFRCLHHFQLLSFESKCSVYEYFQTLVRESDNTGLKNVKVSSSSMFILTSLLHDIYLESL